MSTDNLNVCGRSPGPPVWTLIQNSPATNEVFQMLHKTDLVSSGGGGISGARSSLRVFISVAFQCGAFQVGMFEAGYVQTGVAPSAGVSHCGVPITSPRGPSHSAHAWGLKILAWSAASIMKAHTECGATSILSKDMRLCSRQW